MKIGEDVRIDDFVTLSASRGFITLGSFILIAKGCHLSGPFGIVMQDFSGIAAFNVIYNLGGEQVFPPPDWQPVRSQISLTNPTQIVAAGQGATELRLEED